ncbi:MAG: hypothetical protein AB7L91_02375 [Dehalococcoidia bacterium]
MTANDDRHAGDTVVSRSRRAGDATGAAMADAAPRDGDIVVAQDPSAPARYTLRRVPDAPQISSTSHSGAVEVAQGFARRHRVDVWTVDGRTQTRLHRYRQTSPLRAGARAATPPGVHIPVSFERAAVSSPTSSSIRPQFLGATGREPEDQP